MKESYKKHKETISFVIVLIAAFALARLFTIFVFQSYIVDGASMETALQDKDRLIVNKYKTTASSITGNTYMPKRYEIIVFNLQESSSLGESENRQLIKRVIGLPGDRVTIESGIVKVFNGENPDGFIVDNYGPEKDEPTVQQTSGKEDITVKENEVFVLGDNRNNSLDSRSFGTIDTSSIVGTASLRVFPFDKAKRL